MCLGKDPVSDLPRFCGEDLEASELETVLGIQIDNKLNFEKDVKPLCSQAFQKLGALQRISNLLDTQKKNLLFFCHPTSRQTSHIPNIPHPKHLTSRTSHTPKYLTSQTSHNQNIPHPERSTSRTSHIPNIAHPEHPTS